MLPFGIRWASQNMEESPPNLSEPHSWHTSWQGAHGGYLWSAQIQDMQVLPPTGDPVEIPEWDSLLGMLPPPPCPLPAPPWECQHLFIVPKRTLCLLSKEHNKQKDFLSPQKWAVMSFP